MLPENFVLSYSAWSTYKKSPLQFYFQYIKKAKPTNDGYQVYGDAGNVIHEACEYYIKHGCDDGFIKELWLIKKIDDQTGIRGAKLKFDDYRKMLDNAEQIVDIYSDYPNQPELKINKTFFGVEFKAYLDWYIEKSSDEIIILDWKTNSSATYKMHRDQRLFYSWLIWKIKNIVPKTEWQYLKHGKPSADQFTVDELIEFENEIKSFIQEIEKKGDDVSNYEPGDYKNLFNKHLDLCEEEIANRSVHVSNSLTLVFENHGHYVFIKGEMPIELENGIDFATKFDLPDKHIAMQKAKEKYGPFKNLAEVGTIHLYKKSHRCFGIGLIDKVKKVFQDYSDYYKVKVKIIDEDKRDQNILNKKLNIMPSKLNVDYDFHYYQKDAIKIFLEKQYGGVVAIATGGGKTIVGLELIRQIDGITMWLIDRKELLYQTKEELEEKLGQEIGMIGDGICETKNVTVALVQTLSRNIHKYENYLRNVNFLVVDEFHKAAADTFQKTLQYMQNTKYRLGLTATPSRADGKEHILFSIIGDVIYTKTTRELINEGYLMDPTIQFFKLPTDFFQKRMSYNDEYNEYVVRNDFRNNLIKDYIHKKNVKTMILVKRIEHGNILNSIIKDSHFINGSLQNKKRKQIYKDFLDNKYKNLIIMNSIAGEGLNIPDLVLIANAAANKTDEKTVQVLGRALRKCPDKTEAIYIDFVDQGKHSEKHSKLRIKAFENEGHKVEVLETFI